MSGLSPLAAAAGAGALGLLVLAARRPALACGLLALAIPLTAGMERGAAVPVLRVNEALLLVVAAGVLVHWLSRRRPLAFTDLDVAVLAFCLVGVVVPWAVIVLSRADAELADWLIVLGPIQYLVVYLLFSRTEFSAADLRRFFHLCMLASIPVAAVAVAQALDLGGARDLVSAVYPAAPVPAWDAVYRPASLLGHYSALGAFGLLNLLLALALAVTRHPGFSQRWLTVVMGVNLLSLVTSQTYAPAVALVAGVAVILLAARRFPWPQAAAAPPGLALAAVVFWPSITARLGAQAPAGAGAILPETLQTRVDYWQDFFVPALLRHGPWLGTGTLIPPEVPRPLVDFVDNGYLWQLFRAGLPGLVVLLAVLGAVAAAGWAARRAQDPSHRAIGLTCAGAVAGVVLMEVTSEYLTFTAVSQEFWMLVGLLGGFAASRRPAARPLVELRPSTPTWTGPPRWAGPPGWAAAAVRARRLAARGGLVRSSAVLTAGNAGARVLSLLFSIAAARLLAPAGYGVLAYALVVANIGSVLIVNAPLLLTRFLSRHRDDPAERDAYFTNWALVMAGIVVTSAALLTPVGLAAGLGGWLLAALLANLAGTAVLQTYQQVQCGMERFGLMVGFWMLANLLQLGAALGAGLLGLADPALLLAIYGLSSVAALCVLLPLAPAPVRVLRRALRGERVRGIARSIVPLALMNACTTIWLGADVVLVERMLAPAAAGRYAAAKVVVNGFAIVSWAVSSAVLPRASTLSGAALRAYLLRAVALTAGAVLPLLLALAVIARPLMGLIFGERYVEAGTPLTLLAAAMAVYALYMVVESAWLGLGRPAAAALASGTGMAITVAGGLALVPRAGLTGAAVAFAAGSVAQLAVLAALTLTDLRQPSERRPPPEPVVVDASGSPVSVVTLLRARLLGLVRRGAPVVLVAGPLRAPRALRLLGPDLLLVGDPASRDAGRAAGVLTELAAAGAAALVEEVVLDRRPPAVSGRAVAAARLRRLLRDWHGLLRRLRWPERPGYVPQRTATAPVVPVEAPRRAPAPARPRTARVGVAAALDGGSPAAAAAALLGLRVEGAEDGVRQLVDRALAERWDLLAVPASAMVAGDAPAEALSAFAGRGGTLLLEGLDARANAVLARLPIALPAVQSGPVGRRLLIPARQAAFAGPLGGTEVRAACGEHVLEPCAAEQVLAWAVGEGGTRAAVVAEHRHGRGRVVLSTLRPAGPAARPADVLASERAGGLVAALLLLRRQFGVAAWHAPVPIANFTIDDPALRQGMLGLHYDILAAQARDHRFHATIATVPGELPLADEAVLHRLRRHPDLLSACYHGCDHEGYEFPPAAARPLAEQRAALALAVERGLGFARGGGGRLDRVLVFPYGVGPAALFPELHRLGFLATCNYWDKYPLDAPVPDEPDLGLRPADLAWEGFPLLWRRGLDDEGYLLDLLLGRPALLFAHRRDLGRDFLPFVERARAINAATGGAAAWCGLEDVARHAYLQRRRPDAGWEVLMTANEACLHNPGPSPREYTVTRPGLPEGSALVADGEAGPGQLSVEVPAEGTALVRVALDGAAAPLADGARRCPIDSARPGARR